MIHEHCKTSRALKGVTVGSWSLYGGGGGVLFAEWGGHSPPVCRGIELQRQKLTSQGDFGTVV